MADINDQFDGQAADLRDAGPVDGAVQPGASAADPETTPVAMEDRPGVSKLQAAAVIILACVLFVVVFYSMTKPKKGLLIPTYRPVCPNGQPMPAGFACPPVK